MRRKKLIILPRLDDRNGDASKKWQIVYWVLNSKNNQMVRFRINKGLSSADIPYDEKKRKADEIIKEVTEKLKNGWTPFMSNDTVIYEDELRYRHVSQIYRNAVASNNTARYLASEYLKSINFEKSEATISTYRSKLRIFCDWLDYNGYGDNDITCITNDTLIDFFNFQIQERELSGNTIRKFKNTLHLFFEFVCKKKYTRYNPVVALPVTNRINDEAPRPIQDDDVIILKNKIAEKDPQLWLAIQFQYYCALRPGKELRLLRIFDIDFGGGYVYVSAQRAKTKKTRAVKIPDSFLEILKNEYCLHKCNKADYIFGKDGKPGIKPVGKNYLRYKFNEYRDELGLSYTYKFYSWKHTGALKLLRSGFSIDDISNHLGHTSKSSTEHYIKSKLGWETEKIAKEYPVL